MPWDLLGPASSPPSNVDVSPRPGTMHYQLPSLRNLSLLTAIEVRSTCHLIGCRSEDLTTRLPSSLVPTEPSVTLLGLTVTWHKSQAPAGQKSKVRSFIYGASMRENLWFLGKKVKIWKFSKFCFWPNQGHTEVKWGQFGSLKVIEGQSRSLEVELFMK